MALAKQTMGAGFPPAQAVAIGGAVADALTAAGTTQGTAYVINNGVNVFSTVGASSGAVLPSYASPGDEVWVYNAGANALTVYPQTSSKINSGSTNAGVTVGTNTVCVFKCVNATRWIANLSA